MGTQTHPLPKRDKMIHLKRYTVLSFGLVSLLAVVLTFLLSSGVIAQAGEGSENEFLLQLIENAQSDAERYYHEQTLLMVQADQADDNDALAVVRDNLIQFGQENKQDIYGARAFTLAGDIETLYLHNTSEGRNLYDEAFALFTAQAYHDDSDQYLPYIGQMKGFTYLFEGNPEGAIETWKDVFFLFPRQDMSLQLPGLISNAYRNLHPGKEGWQASMDFYDKALEAMRDVPERGRLAAERLLLMDLGVTQFYIPADDYIDEVKVVFEAYPPGANEFFDINRYIMADKAKQFAEKYPTRAKELAKQARLAANEARDAMNAPLPTDQHAAAEVPDAATTQRATTRVQAPQPEQAPGAGSVANIGWINLPAIGALVLLAVVVFCRLRRKKSV